MATRDHGKHGPPAGRASWHERHTIEAGAVGGDPRSHCSHSSVGFLGPTKLEPTSYEQRCSVLGNGSSDRTTKYNPMEPNNLMAVFCSNDGGRVPMAGNGDKDCGDNAGSAISTMGILCMLMFDNGGNGNNATRQNLLPAIDQARFPNANAMATLQKPQDR